jgi:hypothetical protein
VKKKFLGLNVTYSATGSYLIYSGIRF